MKKIKGLFIFVAIFAITLCLVACGDSTSTSSNTTVNNTTADFTTSATTTTKQDLGDVFVFNVLNANTKALENSYTGSMDGEENEFYVKNGKLYMPIYSKQIKNGEAYITYELGNALNAYKVSSTGVTTKLASGENTIKLKDYSQIHISEKDNLTSLDSEGITVFLYASDLISQINTADNITLVSSTTIYGGDEPLENSITLDKNDALECINENKIELSFDHSEDVKLYRKNNTNADSLIPANTKTELSIDDIGSIKCVTVYIAKENVIIENRVIYLVSNIAEITYKNQTINAFLLGSEIRTDSNVLDVHVDDLSLFLVDDEATIETASETVPSIQFKNDYYQMSFDLNTEDFVFKQNANFNIMYSKYSEVYSVSCVVEDEEDDGYYSTICEIYYVFGEHRNCGYKAERYCKYCGEELVEDECDNTNCHRLVNANACEKYCHADGELNNAIQETENAVISILNRLDFKCTETLDTIAATVETVIVGFDSSSMDKIYVTTTDNLEDLFIEANAISYTWENAYSSTGQIWYKIHFEDGIKKEVGFNDFNINDFTINSVTFNDDIPYFNLYYSFILNRQMKKRAIEHTHTIINFAKTRVQEEAASGGIISVKIYSENGEMKMKLDDYSAEPAEINNVYMNGYIIVKFDTSTINMEYESSDDLFVDGFKVTIENDAVKIK